MAVPAHDTRDYAFAESVRPPIVACLSRAMRPDIHRPDGAGRQACFVGESPPFNSGPYEANVRTTSSYDHRRICLRWVSVSGHNYMLVSRRSAAIDSGLAVSHSARADYAGQPNRLLRAVPVERARRCPSPRGFLSRMVERASAPRALPSLAVSDFGGQPRFKARLTRCRSGPHPAGTIFPYRSARTAALSSSRPKNSPGCSSTCTSTSPSTPCCIAVRAFLAQCPVRLLLCQYF